MKLLLLALFISANVHAQTDSALNKKSDADLWAMYQFNQMAWGKKEPVQKYLDRAERYWMELAKRDSVLFSRGKKRGK